MIFDIYQIKDVCEGIFDGPHATPKETDSGFIFLGIKNITEDGRLDFSDSRLISEDEYPKWTKRVVPKKDDIVFSYEATLHRYALIPEGFKGCLGRRMGLVRVDKKKVYPKYMYYYFLSSKWRKKMEENIIVGSTVDRISIIKFPHFEVEIPILETQKKIASILSNYDDLIQTNQQRIALLEEAAQRLYDEWFVKLRFPNHEQVPVVDGVPEGWERVTFADICESVGGGTPSTKVNEYWENGDVSWVTPTDITRLSSLILLDTEKKITQKGLKDSSAKMLPANTILMTSRASIGYFGLIDRPVCTNQGFISIIPNNDIDRMFILFNLKSRLEEIDGLATGSTFKELSRRVFRAMSITLPTRELRQFFSDFVLPLFEQMRTITQQNQKLAQARDALLPRLMSGKMDVSCLSLKEIA